MENNKKNRKQVWLNKKQFQFIFDTENETNRRFFKAKSHIQENFLENKKLSINTLLRKQKNRTWIGGRGSGKTTVMSYIIFLCYLLLPKAKFGLLGVSLKQLKNNTLSEIKKNLKEMGILENYHYVFAKKPQKTFAKPYYEVEDYKNVLTFNNGFTIELYSATQTEFAQRGGSLDGLLVDEYSFLDKKWLQADMYPLVRANKFRRIAKCPLHACILNFSSAPTTLEGQFVFEDEKAAKEDPDNFFYMESTTYDNIDVVGIEYINTLKKKLSKGRFLIEVENHRITKPEDGFYINFNENRHTYTNTDKTDIKKEVKLTLSFDFNASFTSMLVCQIDRNTLRVVDVLFVKYSTVTALIDIFAQKYDWLTIKDIDVYGDRTGYKEDSITGISAYDEIRAGLLKNGFNPAIKAIAANIEHYTKYQVINNFLKGNKEKHFFINNATCLDLVISMYNSLSMPDFSKDKRIEKKDVAEESMTHLSDALDYILFPFITLVESFAPNPKDLL